jgi:hypothetical protein
VPGTVEPSLHHLFHGFRSVCDVLAHQLLPVPDGAHALGRRLAVEVVVLEVVVLGHIGGVPEGNIRQGDGERKRRRRCEGPLTAARTMGAHLVHELERLPREFRCRDSPRRRCSQTLGRRRSKRRRQSDAGAG